MLCKGEGGAVRREVREDGRRKQEDEMKDAMKVLKVVGTLAGAAVQVLKVLEEWKKGK